MTAEQKMKALGWSLWSDRPAERSVTKSVRMYNGVGAYWDTEAASYYDRKNVRHWYCWFISANGEQIMGCSAPSIAGCWKRLAASIIPLMRKTTFASQQAPLPKLNKPKKRKQTKRKTRRS